MTGLPDSLRPEKLFLFEQFGRKLLVDLPSGLALPISSAAWSLLHNLQQYGRLEGEGAAFSAEEIAPAFQELAELVEVGHLCGPEPHAPSDDFPPTGLSSVLLNLTHRCNLACRYCIMAMPKLRQDYQRGISSMTEATAYQAIDFIRPHSVPGLTLTFFGGEPLLEFARMKRVVEYAESAYPNWFDYQIITNGTLLKPEMIDFFKKYEFSFLFSLDGHEEAHDRLRVYKRGGGSVFRDAFGNLQQLRQAYPDCRCKVNSTYFKPTLDLFESLKFFVEAGIPHLRFDRGLVHQESPYAVTMKEISQVKRQFDDMARYYLEGLLAGGVYLLDPFILFMKRISKKVRRYRVCNTGVDYITIAANGDIYSCYKLLGLEEQRLGHVQEGFSPTAAWKIWTRHVLQRPGCSDCWARFYCGGGCIADNYHLKGDFFEPLEENCEILQHLIKLSLWLYFELEEAVAGTLKQLLGDDYLLREEVPRRIPENYEEVAPGSVRSNLFDSLYELNPVAQHIFQLCDGRHTIEAIARAMKEAYGISHSLALNDVRTQVFRLMSAGLVQTALH